MNLAPLKEPVTHLDNGKQRVLVFSRVYISYRDIALMNITMAQGGRLNAGWYHLQIHRDILARLPVPVIRGVRHPDGGPRD